MNYYGNNDWRDYLAHYGVSKSSGAKIGSGRYPLGSGKNPGQGTAKYYVSKQKAGSSGSGPGRVNYTNPQQSLSRLTDRDFHGVTVYTNPTKEMMAAFPRTSFFSNHQKIVKTPAASKAKNTKPIPGLKLKTREYTLDEDLACTNPSGSSETNNNCMFCTTAFELRRRGYDVAAKYSENGYPDEKVLDWFKDIDVNTTNELWTWGDYVRSAKAVNSVLGNRRLEKAVTKDLKRQGVGARGNMMLTLSLYGGHSIAYEVTKKGVVFYDAQQVQKYNEKETKKILRRVLGAGYARYDDAEFNPDTISEYAFNREKDTPDTYAKPGVRFKV